MRHPLVTLGGTVSWGFLEEQFGEAYTGRPATVAEPLDAGPSHLKHTYDLSDEVLCERRVETPCYQYFCGEEFFQQRLVFDRSSLTCWRNRIGEEWLAAMIQESPVATRTKAIQPSELSRVMSTPRCSSRT
jgi:transposase, IS5 family